MIVDYALWGVGIAVFAAALSFIVVKEHRRVRKRKIELRTLNKLFDTQKEEKH